MAPARNYSRSGRLATPTLPDAHIGEDSRGAKGLLHRPEILLNCPASCRAPPACRFAERAFSNEVHLVAGRRSSLINALSRSRAPVVRQWVRQWSSLAASHLTGLPRGRTVIPDISVRV